MPTVREWTKDAVSELFALDSKVPRTLRKLAWPPGELTLEWRRGRRAHYVQPFRLYLAASLLFFLTWTYSPFRALLEGLTTGLIDARTDSGSAVSDAGTSIVDLTIRTITQNLPQLLLILLVPLFAFLLQRANHGRGRYVEHLVLALHVHVGWFLLMGALGPLGAGPVGALAMIMLLVWETMVLKRVYALRAGHAVWMTAIVSIAYAIVSLVVIATMLTVVAG